MTKPQARQYSSVLMMWLTASALAAEPVADVAGAYQVRVNQAGYQSHGTKAFYPSQVGELQLLDVVSAKVIKRYQVTAANQALYLPEQLPAGWYQLHSDSQQSAVFEVSDAVLDNTVATLLAAFRYQHAGVAIRDVVSGVQRPPAHLNDGVIARDDEINQAGDRFDGSGGWYDAGDYGKYVATTAITAARMLDAAVDSQQPTLQQRLRQEALIGLDWLARMQRADGAFYRKIGAEKWPPLVPPHQDRQVRLVYGVSTPDSAKAVAALAQAARMLMDDDPQRSQRYLRQAQLGWQWLALQPQQFIDWQAGDDGGSGPYMYNQWDTQSSLQHDEDDRFWAAVELYLATDDSQYYRYLQTHLPPVVSIFEWKDPSVLGMWHLLISGHAGELTEPLQLRFNSHCQRLRQNAYRGEFQVANQRFIWGSNKMVAEEGILFGYCYRLSGDAEYLNLAWSQWNYLFGINPFGLSYVTGVGEHAVENLHHIWGRAVGFVPPGMLVGGPNQDAQAGFAPKALGMRSYVDDAKDYSVNEFAIDYNAAAIGLGALLANPDGVSQQQAQQ